MAYDEHLAERTRKAVANHSEVVEKKMFGGLAFLLNGHMCCGVVGEELMVRVGAADYTAALCRPHTREMDFTGKPLTGFVYVQKDGVATAASLRTWVDRGTRFASTLPPRQARRRKRRTR